MLEVKEFEFEDPKFDEDDEEGKDCPHCSGLGYSQEDLAECTLCDGDGFLYD